MIQLTVYRNNKKQNVEKHVLPACEKAPSLEKMNKKTTKRVKSTKRNIAKAIVVQLISET